MEVIRPRSFKLSLTAKENLAGNYWSFRFEGDELTYRAGQYVSLKVDEAGERRSYSVASWPGQSQLELLVDVTPMGMGSKFLLGLNLGDEIEALGPLGRFTVEDEQRKAAKGLLFVGTGSGIVPLRSMIHNLLENRGEKKSVRLHWGMRFEEDLFWTKEFLELERRYPNFKVDVVLSRAGEMWRGCKGHVNDCLVEHMGDGGGWQAYLCGSREMIEGVSQLLLKKGMGHEAIHQEKFY